MKVSQVTVSLQKRVNDGDYGSEMAEAQYVVIVDEGEDADAVVATMLARARGRVFNELGATNNQAVARRLNPPARLCSICGDAPKPLGLDESYSHVDCRNARTLSAVAAGVDFPSDGFGDGDDVEDAHQ